MRRVRAGVAVAAGVWVGVGGGVAPLGAQGLPHRGAFTTSLGQPSGWLWTLGASAGTRSRDGDRMALGEVRAGVYRELVSRALGVGGVQLEGYGGSVGTALDAGVRARLVSPFARLAVGADYNAVDGRVRPLLTVLHPWRRGGLFRDGSVVRLDVMPGPGSRVSLGIEKPAFRAIPPGATRPLSDRVRLTARATPAPPLPPDPALRNALATVREAARNVQRLALPWLDHTGSGGDASDAAVVTRLRELQRFVGGIEGSGTPPLERETRRLHAAIDRAFALVLPRSLVERVAAESRAILLEEVLLPYDRLLGQAKDEDSTRPFALLGRQRFERWLHVASGVDPAARAGASAVFADLLESVDGARADASRRAGGARFGWLALQLALLPEQHDTQDELDALVARATGERFSDGNFVSYVINEQFQYHLSRTIREAEDYHVLWTHDFRGVDGNGQPDEMAFRQVLRSYLAALTARVRAYDSTGTFPSYFIILDEWFYEVNQGRRWMTLLEDPLHHRVSLPAAYRAWEDTLAAAQDSLRAAVDASPLLTAQRRLLDERWLRNLVKVHVNITNAADPTFWSWRVASNFPMPDNWMRDHRKVAFYDLTEADPYRGEALFTGAGVGEHYANLSWEDRSLLVRGPAVLALMGAAHDLLRTQGIAPDRIPAPLRPVARAADYDQQVARAVRGDQRPSRAMVVHNETGFGAKRVNVAKAVLYTLTPAGSVIKIPDSLWNGTFWGSALVGCALRGVRVLVIAPALANAPARAFGSMARSRELVWRLATASRLLAPEIEAAGGLLKVGLFASDLRVTDIPGKVRSVRRTLEAHQWLRDLFDFPPSVYPGLDELAETFSQLSMAAPRAAGTAGDFESGERSMLHLKANYIASREAWTLMARPEWVELTWEFVQQRIAQVQTRRAAITSFEASPDALLDVGGGVAQRWLDALPPEERERVLF